MDRIDVVLRCERQGTAVVLVEVWYDEYRNGDRVECLQLSRQFADDAWKRWETVAFETTARAQLSLF